MTPFETQTVSLREACLHLGNPRRTSMETGSTPQTIFVLLSLALVSCGADLYDNEHVEATNRWLVDFAYHKPSRVLRGRASYYHDSLAGRLTANGEIYDPRILSGASRTLPFGTIVRVRREDAPHQVIVRINDRGPFGDRRRILDLSREAATRLHMLRKGVVPIRAEILWMPAPREPGGKRAFSK